MAQSILPPSVLFDHPLCGEVMGAGFQRVQESSVGSVHDFACPFDSAIAV